MARRVTSRDRWKAKSWYTILAPEEFGDKEVGETPAAGSEEVVGRRVEVTARDIATGQRLNQVKLVLEVESVAGDKARTKLAGYEISRSYLRSLIRRRRRRIDLVKDVEVGGRALRVKMVVMALKGCHANHGKDIRKALGEMLEAAAEDAELGSFIQSLLDRELQEAMRDKVKKVFPVAAVEVRKIDFRD